MAIVKHFTLKSCLKDFVIGDLLAKPQHLKKMPKLFINQGRNIMKGIIFLGSDSIQELYLAHLERYDLIQWFEINSVTFQA